VLIIGLIKFDKNVNILSVQKFFIITTAVYCCVGEVFYPGYHLAYIQLNIVLPLVYSVSKKFNTRFIIIFATSYLGVFNYFNLHEQKESYANYIFDINTAVITVAMLTLFLYLYVDAIKKEKTIIDNQFKKLGKNLSRVVHDIKSGIQAPVMMVDDLIQNKSEYSPSEFDSTLVDVKDFLGDIQLDLRNVNSFFEVINDKEDNDMSIITSKLSEEYKIQNPDKKLLHLSIKGDNSINFNKKLLESVIRNLISNSFYYGKSEFFIEINIKNNTMKYLDSNGGYPVEVLSNINKGIPVNSNRSDGNGVGLVGIKEVLEDCGSKIYFFNKGEKACVEIVF
jgi:K+-sensing histidine kinase KdpD